MPTLAEKLQAARNEVARLEREATSATCADLGHAWCHVGGANAGCGPDCSCSVPVYSCNRCGDSDYGQNAEAVEVRADCFERYGYPTCPKCDEEIDFINGCSCSTNGDD